MTKKIKTKNYFILIGIILATFVICFYLFSWIKQYNELKMGDPIIKSTLQEVKYDNLKSLLKERDFVIIYMCTTSEKVCRSFEKKFTTYIKEENLNDQIIYFNLGYSQEENNVLSKIYNNYKHEDLIKKLNNYPSILIFSNSKIIDLLSGSKDNYLTIFSVNEFLKGYDILND